MKHRPAQPSIRAALLIVDMINTFEFPGGNQLARSAARIVPSIQKVRRRFLNRGWPVVFCNDNFCQWHSDFRKVIDNCREKGPGGSIALALQPDPKEYFVLKPKHSGFYATPLDLLLRTLRVRKIVLTGVAGDGCVLATALDGHIRDYEVAIIAGATASQTAARNRRALEHLQTTRSAHVVETFR